MLLPVNWIVNKGERMFKISDETAQFIRKEMTRYETKRSALIPSLFRIQKDNGGWVSSECVSALSQLMDMPPAWIYEALHFYTMFNTRPVGRLHVQVCTNVSCSMNGGEELLQHLCERYKVKLGEVSADGFITISQVECLASCDTAPMMQVNENYHENLTQEKAVKLLEDMR